MKTHNIKKLTVECDPDGAVFSLTVKMNDGGELKMNGRFALSTFIEMTKSVVSCYIEYTEIKETVH